MVVKTDEGITLPEGTLVTVVGASGGVLKLRCEITIEGILPFRLGVSLKDRREAK